MRSGKMYGRKEKLKMKLNKISCRLSKRRGYRYLIVQKKTNDVKIAHKELKEAVSDVFGFSMSNVSVGIYDIELDRYLEPNEYEEEMKKVIDYQKENGFL